MTKKRKICVYICALLLLLSGSVRAQAQGSLAALLIANQTYRWAPLETPINDVEALGKNFQQLGFSVQQAHNLSQNDFFATIDNFIKKHSHSETLVFFYAGHAVQLNGRNYLIPIDADIESPDLLSKIFDLGYLLERLSSIPTQSRLIILDACRSNPFNTIPNASSGLSELLAPPNTLVAFSTAPGHTADDGDGKHSPYTYGLLKYLFQPDAWIESAFKSVRRHVRISTENRQIPWESTSLENNIKFQQKSMIKQNKKTTKPATAVNSAALAICGRILTKYSLGSMSLTPEEQAVAPSCK
jgi:uncharacterized caspase-like protein